MTRFGESRFSVGSNSKSAAKNYADNWDAVFGARSAGEKLATATSDDVFVCPHGDDCVHGCQRQQTDRFEAWQDAQESCDRDDDDQFREG